MKYRPFEELYEKVLIQEMNQEVIDYIASQRTEELPWDNLFGDKKRMIIPLEKESRFSSILSELRNLPYFHEFDPDNERIIFKKPRDPKYGKGNFSLQGKSIGSAINDLPLSDGNKKHALNVFATYKAEFLKELKDPSRDSEYSIVFSRSPNDIIRMSDWKKLESCLSKKGCNFHRVAHEAIKGGGVAYVVKNKYLDDFKDDPDFLNGEDTFSDDQRDIEAVQEPESRIKVRRFVSDKGMDFAVPENALFGNQRLPTFYQSVVNYLKPRQATAEEVKKAFKDDEITLKGSSYGMKDLEYMIGEYFNEDSQQFINYDPEDYADKYEHERIKSLVAPDGPDFEDELQRIDNQYPLEHAYSGWDLNFDDGDYYTFYGGINIELEDLELSEDVDEDLDSDYTILRRIRQGDNFAMFIQELSEKNFNDLEMTSYSYDSQSGMMHIGLTPNDSISSDSNDYENFRYHLKRTDDEYEDYQEEITQMLLRYDLIESAENRPGEYQRLRAEQVEENEWDNFGYEATLRNLKLINYRGDVLIHNSQSSKDYESMSPEEFQQRAYFERDFDRFCRTWKQSIEETVKDYILNLMDHNFRPPSMKSSMEQGELGLVYEQMRMHPSQRLVDFDLKVLLNKVDDETIKYSNFSLTTNTAKDVAFELADWLDEMWKHVEGMLTLVAWECVKQTVDTSPRIQNTDNQYFGFIPQNIVQLQRLYGKYIDMSNIGKI